MGLNNNLAECLEDLNGVQANRRNRNNVSYVEQFNGSIRKKKRSNKPCGKSSEVYPFKSVDEIKMIIQTIDKHIEDATTDYNKKRWCRNKLLFIIGINIGIRGSDLCELKWRDFFYDDFVFRDGIAIQPIKTKNTPS